MAKRQQKPVLIQKQIFEKRAPIRTSKKVCTKKWCKPYFTNFIVNASIHLKLQKTEIVIKSKYLDRMNTHTQVLTTYLYYIFHLN